MRIVLSAQTYHPGFQNRTTFSQFSPSLAFPYPGMPVAPELAVSLRGIPFMCAFGSQRHIIGVSGFNNTGICSKNKYK